MSFSFKTFTVTSEAKADGIEVNSCYLVLLDDNNYAQGKEVEFTLTGNAIFSESKNNEGFVE